MDFELKLALIESSSYREFIREYLNGRYAGRKISLEEFCLRTGVKSRSFFSEMLRGKRSITASSFPLIIAGMNLTGVTKSVFQLLVYKEESKLRAKNTSLESINNQLRRHREKFRSQKKKDFNFSNYECMRVFSSMGSIQKGASFSEILTRSKVLKKDLILILKKFEYLDLVYKRNERYFIKNEVLDFDRLGTNNSFKDVFCEGLNRVRRKAKKMQDYESDLFLCSSISVRRGQVDQFKESLKEAVTRCFDEYQVDDGELVKDILVSII